MRAQFTGSTAWPKCRIGGAGGACGATDGDGGVLVERERGGTWSGRGRETPADDFIGRSSPTRGAVRFLLCCSSGEGPREHGEVYQLPVESSLANPAAQGPPSETDYEED